MGLLGLLGEIRRIRARRAMDLIAIVARVRDPIAAMQQGSSSVVFPTRIRAYLIRVYTRTLEVLLS